MAIAKVIELTVGSPIGFADAIKQGIASVNAGGGADVTGVWLQDQKCVVEKGSITEYRVTMKVTAVETTGRAALKAAPKPKKLKVSAQVGKTKFHAD